MSIFTHRRHLLDDTLLILIMAVLAGCGLVYEYLLSHYAGRVLGIMESTIYAMIGLMIVAMGLGAFAARWIKCEFNGFVYLELTVALLGSTCIIIISSLIGFTQVLPQVIADTFALPNDSLPKGGLFKQVTQLAFASPYFFGLILGFLIGMEIPLIARIRERVHQQHLANNIGTIYGADYVGAGIGAAIWVTVLLNIDISEAAALTASLNLLMGAFFVIRFWPKLKRKVLIVIIHFVLALVIALVYQSGNQWLNRMSNLLYLDNVVYQGHTRYQQVTFTERNMGGNNESVINFYLNGRLQFSSNDEHIYHGYLVAPAMLGSARHDRVLIIGGGDGLALRDVLRWQPKQVTLIDLDSELISLFKAPHKALDKTIADKIIKLNADSLNDPRVNLITADAYLAIDSLLENKNYFDVILVDLPDPSHPDLNKLYSVNFYARLKQLLSGDGLITVQSTSPYHARDAFISVGKTVEAAGFNHVQQLHANVPSFGEWGWTVASKQGAKPQARIANSEKELLSSWLTPQLLQAAFAFPKHFYQNRDEVKVNYLGSHTIYQYHQRAWQQQQGLENSLIEKN